MSLLKAYARLNPTLLWYWVLSNSAEKLTQKINHLGRGDNVYYNTQRVDSRTCTQHTAMTIPQCNETSQYK